MDCRLKKPGLDRLPRWLLTVVCVAAIVYLTLVPKPVPEPGFRLWEHTDKIIHALMFGGLYFCASTDCFRYHGPRVWQRSLLAFAVIAFGGLIELLQGWMNIGRGRDFYDFLADAAGTLLACLIF